MKAGRYILAAGILLFLFMLASLLMMSDALQNSETFSEYYSGLLVFIAVGLVVLIVLIAINFRNLIRQLRNRTPGARITLRMVAMFALLSTTPLLIVYYFSLDFLHRGIDSWFDLRMEQALDDSIELSRLSLDLRMKELMQQSQQMAREFSEITNIAVPFEIDEYRLRIRAEELTLMTRKGSIIASSVGDPSRLVPDRPDEAILFQVQQGANYIGLETTRNSGLSVRVVVNVPQLGIEPEPRILQAMFVIPERLNVLANSVQSAFIKYRELSYLRDQLKFSFVLILTLVLLFSIFSAVWAAFYFAQRLAAPIRDLADGTRSVAAGDYSTQLPIPGRDELGFLVASFNEMTRRIASARDEVRQSQREAEAQRAYLEAVLARLSSGVLVLDEHEALRTANISSGEILGVNVNDILGKSLAELQSRYPYLDQLANAVRGHLGKDENDWREQVVIFGTGGRQILMCSGTTLTLDAQEPTHVYVIVFDDITALVKGQRDAAWGEMARRLAHEIKNPLTPIQLAAERLRHKYLGKLDASESGTLDRLTNTIVQQVETMKDMVNTFSEYARAPSISPQYVDLNELLQGVIDLYGNLDPRAQIRLEFAPDLPRVRVDPGRIRQVFNNLLKNAFDAARRDSRTVLTISTAHVLERGLRYIEVRIKDSGTGISEDIIPTVFEPYMTTKTKGTGLGLAIVKKTIEEHNGLVWLENNRDGPGACAVIRLPVTTAMEPDEESHSDAQKRDAV